MLAGQAGDRHAERMLETWAARGMPVAQRELGILYLAREERSGPARTLLERAARAGDAEAAFRMGELGRAGKPSAATAAWYRQAALADHSRAALMLGLVLKNGEGVPVDRAGAVRWFEVAARAGNAHAMFLLSNAYADGDGVPADPKRARAMLERAATREYPAALQQLAIIKESGDAWSAKDGAQAAQLWKEATEHRRNNANRF